MQTGEPLIPNSNGRLSRPSGRCSSRRTGGWSRVPAGPPPGAPPPLRQPARLAPPAPARQPDPPCALLTGQKGRLGFAPTVPGARAPPGGGWEKRPLMRMYPAPDCVGQVGTLGEGGLPSLRKSEGKGREGDHRVPD